MASRRDGATAVGATPPSTPSRATLHRSPAAPTRDPAAASPRAHLGRNYAALERAATGRTSAAGDSYAERRPTGTMRKDPRVQGTQGPGSRMPGDTTATRGPEGTPPPQTAPPWGQEELDYAQSEEDAHHLSAGAEHAAPRSVAPPDHRPGAAHPGGHEQNPHHGRRHL